VVERIDQRALLLERRLDGGCLVPALFDPLR
jgi:hypothetical protein